MPAKELTARIEADQPGDEPEMVSQVPSSIHEGLFVYRCLQRG